MTITTLFRKSFLASALAATLTVGFAMPAFAAGPLYRDTTAVSNFSWVSSWQTGISRAKTMGFGRVRYDMSWASIERNRGQYDFSFFDQLYNTLAQNGMKPIFVLDYNNNLYNGGAGTQTGISTQENRDAFARFAAAAAARYKDKGVIWEIWNEPDLNQFWPSPNPENFGRLVEASTAAMRQADPNAYIVNGGIAHAYWDSDFTKRAMAAGALKGINAFAIHSYDPPHPNERNNGPYYGLENQEAWFEQYKQWMSQYNGGRVLPIVNTEFSAAPSQQSSITQTPLDFSAKQNIRLMLDDYYAGVYLSTMYGMDSGDEYRLDRDNEVTRALTYTNNLLANCTGDNVNYGNGMRAILFQNQSNGQKILAWWPISLNNTTVNFPQPLSIQGAYNVYGSQVAQAGSITSYTGNAYGGPVFFILSSGTPAPAPSPGPAPAPAPAPGPAPAPAPGPAPAPAPAGIPATPSNLTLQARTNSNGTFAIDMRWSDNATNEVGYEVWRSTSATSGFTKIASIGVNATTWTDTVNPGTYYYHVRTYNDAGLTPPSNTASISVGVSAPAPAPAPGPAPAPAPAPGPAPAPAPAPAAPLAPSNLVVTVQEANKKFSNQKQVILNWKDNSTNETQFEIWSSFEPNSNFSVAGKVNANVTGWSFSTFSNWRDVYYRVRAINNNGASPFSNTVLLKRF